MAVHRERFMGVIRLAMSRDKGFFAIDTHIRVIKIYKKMVKIERDPLYLFFSNFATLSFSFIYFFLVQVKLVRSLSNLHNQMNVFKQRRRRKEKRQTNKYVTTFQHFSNCFVLDNNRIIAS